MGLLTKADFNLGNFSQVADVKNPIGRFKVPRGKVYFLSPKELMRLFFTATEEVSPGAGSSRTELTVSLTYNIIENPTRSKDNAFYATWNGSKTDIVSVDYQANEVTISVDDTDATAVVYYPLAVGDVQIVAEAPKSIASTAGVEVFGDELIVVHSLDQNKQGGPSANSPITLPENFNLTVYANTPTVLDMGERNAVINVKYTETQLSAWLKKLEQKLGRPVTKSEASDLIIKSWAQKRR